MRIQRLLCSCLIVLAAARPAAAQRAPIPVPPVDSTALVTLRLTDGTELMGRVVARDDTSLVVVTIAGLRVVTPRRAIVGWRAQRGRKFLVEAWKLPGVDEVPAIFGLRFFGSRLTTDFGLIYVLGANTEGFPFFPWVDLLVSF